MRFGPLAFFALPIGLIGILFLGELKYSPERQRQYPTSYGINERAAKAREELQTLNETGRLPGQVGTPKVEILEPIVDLGIVLPHSTETTHFKVKNAGDGVLRLLGGEISCKCVEYSVSNRTVAPGEESVVSLTWNTGNRSEEIAQTLTFQTNDPERKQIQFAVRGRVIVDFEAVPEALELGRLIPDRVGDTASVILRSEEWNSLDEIELLSSDERIRMELRDDVTETEAGFGAKWTRRLVAEIVEAFPSGSFQASATLRWTDPSGERHEHVIPVVGSVAGRLTVGGAGLNGGEILDLGTIHEGEVIAHELILRVNDEVTSLHAVSVSSDPAILECELSPIAESRGVHRLTIRVPRDAPAGSYSGDRAVKLVVEFDHPRIKKLTMDVSLVVLSRISR